MEVFCLYLFKVAIWWFKTLVGHWVWEACIFLMFILFLFASIISSILAFPCLYPHLLLFEILLMADTWRIKSNWKRGKNTIFLTVSFSGNWLIWKSIPLGLLTAGLLFSVFVSGQKKWTYSKRTSYLSLWITSKQRNNNYPSLRKFFSPSSLSEWH